MVTPKFRLRCLLITRIQFFSVDLSAGVQSWDQIVQYIESLRLGAHASKKIQKNYKVTNESYFVPDLENAARYIDAQVSGLFNGQRAWTREKW
jgi:hypothetical protein